MEIFGTILRGTLSAIITLAQLALLLRAIFSWIDMTGEGRISAFLTMLTEPLILPIRKLFEKLHWFENVPFDMAFLSTVIVLALLDALVTFL